MYVDIVDPGSHAAALGVASGWELKHVVGCDMTGSSGPADLAAFPYLRLSRPAP